MTRRISKAEFDARVKALREEPDVPAAKDRLDNEGYCVNYEALASFATRHRDLIQAEPGSAEQALKTIVSRIEQAEKDDLGFMGLASVLGEVKALARKGLGAK